MNAYMLGVIFGVFLGVVALIASKLMKKSTRCEHYDERQMLIRGTGYRISFLSLAIMNLVYTCFFYGVTKDIVAPQAVVICITFVALLIYVLYCIFKDAYIAVGEKPQASILILLLIIIANGLAATSHTYRGISEDGFVSGFFLNVIIVCFFSIVLVALGIKALINKKEAAHEES